MNDYIKTFDARGHEYNDAISACPGAREAERQAVLQHLACQPGTTIIDAPAGGGYVADGLAAQWPGAVNIICVEPSAKFAAPLNGRYQTLISPLDEVELPDHSIDGIVSLAGLHHLNDKRPVYREWLRLLKPDGRLAVGDVSTDTGTGEFLNSFVNEHTPGGHNGIFIAAGEFRAQLEGEGFSVSTERLEDVPWQFPDEDTMGRFCKALFGIANASAAATTAALSKHIGVSVNSDQTIRLNWQLRYAAAVAAG